MILDKLLIDSFVKTTERAAYGASIFKGKNDKIAADQAAVDEMRKVLNTIDMKGKIVIGEGEKDEAPMLFNGEKIGTGSPPEVDIAVDPIDGTTLLSKGLPGAIAVIALSSRDTMNCPQETFYMNKIAVGPEAKDAIDITATVKENLESVASAKACNVKDLVVMKM